MASPVQVLRDALPESIEVKQIGGNNPKLTILIKGYVIGVDLEQATKRLDKVGEKEFIEDMIRGAVANFSALLWSRLIDDRAN